MESISKVVQWQLATQQKPTQEALFWKGFIYYYYLHTRRAVKGQRMYQNNKERQYVQNLSHTIKSCESALLAVNEGQLAISAKYILVKLYLFLEKERFGCDLFYVTQQNVKSQIEAIQRKDPYIGSLALCEHYIDGQEVKVDLAIATIEGLTQQYPARSEAYIKLWSIYMAKGKEYEDASKMTAKEQINRHNSRPLSNTPYDEESRASQEGALKLSLLSQTEDSQENANKEYLKALEVSEKLLSSARDITDSTQKR